MLGKGHAGDPASAMLELLNPEQNANFLDHYFDVPIDLSKIQRMEVIFIAGSPTKKCRSQGIIWRKPRESCGIKPEQVEVTHDALLTLIENYCREAGVRSIQKQIEKIYGKIALQLVRQGKSISSPKNETKVVETADQKGNNSNDPKVSDSGEVQTGDISSEGSESDEVTQSSADAETADADIVSGKVQQSTDQLIEPKDAAEELSEKKEATDAGVPILVDASNLPDFVGKR
ncbi:hypothetical protein QQ045_015052 [Rhodiola kirilowii]